jgi:tetratricopeptide (TPR) repeat protein
MKEALPLKGKISEVTFPRFLMHLNRERMTGTLSVSSEELQKKIHFRKGDAIFASSNFEDDRLGEMLVKSGKITLEQYDRSVEILKKTRKRQGGILVELGYITPKDLFWGVKYQVREIIYSLFLLEQGQYEFSSQEPVPDEMITLKMSMGALIYEGVKRIENWTRIRKELPPMEAVLKLNDDPLALFQEIEFTAQDKKILSLIDGRRTIKQVIEDSWFNSFEAMKILYLLCSLGIVTEKKVEGVAISIEELLKPAAEGEETLRRRVAELYRKLPGLKKHELLEIKKGASFEEIKRNYYRLAKEFHPDRFFDSEESELKERLSAIFDAITDAYNALKRDIHKEEEVEAFVIPDTEPPKVTARPAQGERAASPRRPAAADSKAELERGLLALKKGDLKAALQHLRTATVLEPVKAENWSYLALALSRSPAGLKEAEQALFKAIKLEPANAGYYANLGLLYLRCKMPEQARKQFERTLALEPGNVKAKQGMRQLGIN